jgi:hypothetical protein
MKAKAVPQAAGESDTQPQQETTSAQPQTATPVHFAIVRKDQFSLRPKATAKPAELELIKRLIKAIRGL